MVIILRILPELYDYRVHMCIIVCKHDDAHTNTNYNPKIKQTKKKIIRDASCVRKMKVSQI